ncbi:hypothetical protein INT43_002312 [Umbelopsis isabellina]|uniref:Transcription factor domain-containing protein n=1 Tax=Mortierella isabellina TaxID=91625 RepID=A0A8H7UP32_MORIS|nr:hypothetical protein INT43_002312 [Umbelopsis isabellina]
MALKYDNLCSKEAINAKVNDQLSTYACQRLSIKVEEYDIQEIETTDIKIQNSERSTLHLEVETYSELESILQPLVNKSNVEPRLHGQFELPNVLPDALVPNAVLNLEQRARNQDPRISRLQLSISYEDVMDVIMGKAADEWCCLAFKISPLKVSTAKTWRKQPRPIIDGLASITLATFIGRDCEEDFGMATAAAFYKQASNRMDTLFDCMNDDAVIAYFLLSYASNLMRLSEQQKTWQSLASILLFHLTQNYKHDMDNFDLIRLCWCRWYYIDAWISLTLNRPLLLSNKHPVHVPTLSELISTNSVVNEVTLDLFHFAALGEMMRKAITGLKSRAFFDMNNVPGYSMPSQAYHNFNREHREWFRQLEAAAQAERALVIIGPQKFNFKPKVDVHLHLSYHSICLIILFQFLSPGSQPPEEIIIETLESIFQLLSGLEYLKEINCDQSTYHHMFFAIHSAAKLIYEHCDDDDSVKAIAREQICLNSYLLKATAAYEYDLYKLRSYGEKIDRDFEQLEIESDDEIISTVDESCFQVFRAGPIFRQTKGKQRRQKLRFRKALH